MIDRYLNELFTLRNITIDDCDIVLALYQTPFEVHADVPRDITRMDTVLFNRGISEHDDYPEFVSVLEIIITMVDTIAFTAGTTYSEAFFTLLDNLGVYYNLEDVGDICHRLITRTYDYNGTGGLFPLAYPERDQRLEELWYQCQNWCKETYDT